MKRTIIGATVAVILALSYVPQAEASAFMSITVGATTVSCNNSLAACGAVVGGTFTSAIGSNTITFTGNVGGYQFTQILLTSNAPGAPGIAFTQDTKTAVQNLTAAGLSATINYGVNNYTMPVGPGFLSASHSGTLTTGTAGSETFRSWERNDNGLVAGGAGATAVATTQTCTFPAAAPPEQSCQGPNATIGTPLVTAPFSLTSEEVITLAVGANASFTATTALTPNPIPEPSSVVLLGTGMLFLAGRMFRKRRK